MTAAPASPLLERGGKNAPASDGSSESAPQIEIVAPDRYCTALLLECAAPLFPAEIVSGSGWIVRLQPPAGGGWVLELLALIERWLESARLPCAKVLYGGRSYLVRASTDLTQLVTAMEPAPATGPTR
jgi:hypothetical protein